jgi:hypothetical protein
MTRDTNAKATPEIRTLRAAELDAVTGGTLNCVPIFGEDGRIYSPTLDRVYGPFGKVLFPSIR